MGCQAEAARAAQPRSEARSVPELVARRLATLPPDLQRQVVDFVEFLRQRYQAPTPRHLRQDWAGALSDLDPLPTAMELQREAVLSRER